jgi:phosphatidylglycerophosphate synthase
MIRYSFTKIRKDSRSTYFAWVHLLIYYNLSLPVVWVIANFTNLTPNNVTMIHFVIRLITVYPFYLGSPDALRIGGILVLICTVIDVADGRLARLKNQMSPLGAYMDPMLDSIGDFLIMAALTYSQVVLTNDLSFMFLGMSFVFMNLFVSTENMHLALIRQKIIINDDYKSKSISKVNTEAAKIGIISQIAAKAKSFQKRYGISLVSIDVIEIRFIVYILGPIIGYVKECIIIGVVLLVMKVVWEKSMQIYRKEPVFFVNKEKDGLS